MEADRRSGGSMHPAANRGGRIKELPGRVYWAAGTAIADLILVIVSGLGLFYLRFYPFPESVHHSFWGDPNLPFYSAVFTAYGLLFVLAANGYGLYEVVHPGSHPQDLQHGREGTEKSPVQDTPVHMKTIIIFDRAGAFAENKDVARDIRRREIAPAMEKNEDIVLDFERVDAATQSFVHALISDILRKYGGDALDRISFKSCNETVRQIIGIVVDYMQES